MSEVVSASDSFALMPQILPFWQQYGIGVLDAPVDEKES
jgi:hypothetical protein